MAKRGRKPTPDRLKLLRGTRADRLAPTSAASPGLPEAPDSLDTVGLAEWKRMGPMLADAGLLTVADGPVLALYCSAFSRRELARAEVETTGLLIATDVGGLKANPAVAMQAQAERDMGRLLSELGATPASRSKVNVIPKEEEPELSLQRFLDEGKAKRNGNP